MFRWTSNLACCCVILLAVPLLAGADVVPLIGYTELRTNLSGGRHANVRTMRAAVVRADGSGRRLIAEELAKEPDTWTQFAGWSPDGKTAVVARGWQSPDNAKWEEENKNFRFTKEGCSLDSYFVNLATEKTENITAVERVSFYNSGVFFWRGRQRFGTLLYEASAHVVHGQCRAQFPVEPFNDGTRRVGRRDDPVGQDGVEARQPCLGDRRQIGKQA